MFRLNLKQLAAKKLRLLTTAMAVLLGVAFLAGTLVLTDTIGRSLDNILADANAGTDAYVRGRSDLDVGFGEARPRMTEDLVARVAGVDGVDRAVPRISGYAQIVDKQGEPVGDPQMAPAFGLNWIDVAALNAYRIVNGHAPATDDEIAIDKLSARKAGFVPGDRTTVLSSGAPREFTIAGIATFGTADSPGGATAVLFTTAVAQQLLGKPGQIDGIAATAKSGVSQDELVRAINSVVGGDGVEVITGVALTAEDQRAVADNLSFFNVFMLIFALVAVFVGAFIINNTFSITVAQRSREMAMLRAIGASRGQVLRSVLTEAAAVAAVASGAGLALGIVVARGLRGLLSSFGFDMPDGPAVVTRGTVIASLAVGVGVTLASALFPARRAAKVAPIAALRATAFENSTRSRRRAAIGATLTGSGVVLLLAGLSSPDVRPVGLGSAVVFVGVSVLGPVLARPFTRLIGAPLPRLRGMTGSIARENAMRNPKRTARTAASLMIGVGLVGFITVFAASAKSSLGGSLERDFTGTHIVDSGAFDSTSGMSPDLASTLRAQPSVTALSEARIAHARLEGDDRPAFFAFESKAIGMLFDLGTIQGDLSSLGTDGIAISAEQTTDKGWALGDQVTVQFVSGPQTLVIRAVYGNSEEWVGSEFVDIAAFTAFLPDQLDAHIYLSTSDVDAVKGAAAAFSSVDVLDKDGFIASRNEEINTMLGLIYAMLALAVVIALLGIANTLALSIFERTRELGLLRAVGMARGQVRAAVRWEAALIALFGTTLGLGIGVFFAWAMVHALADEGLNRLVIPVPSLAVVTGIGALAGIGAAVMPARRAAKLNVLRAVASA